MPVKTVRIEARDLKPGHILFTPGGVSRVELAALEPSGENMIVGAVGGKPRRTDYHAFSVDKRVTVTARSHAYAFSPQRADDLRAAQAILTANKALLRPQALELSRGEAVSLSGLTQALRDEGSKQQAAVLQRLPGLRVQIDPEKGLVLTERPATLSLSAAQSWKNLEEAAHNRKLALSASPQSPKGFIDARCRTQQGDDIGVVSRIDMATGAVRTALDGRQDSAQPTLDRAVQKTHLNTAIDQSRALAFENRRLRPDLPHVEKPRDREQRTILLPRTSLVGTFAGISAADHPQMMRVHINKDAERLRVDVPISALDDIKHGTPAGTKLSMQMEGNKPTIRRTAVGRELDIGMR